MEINSATIGKLTEALSKAQGLMNGAEKDGKNPFHKSQYTTLSSVWEACRKPLSDNGLAVIQTVDQFEGNMVLITTLSHCSGEFIRSIVPLMLSKKDSQSLGSAITYARRYGLSSIVGVCPADDDAEEAMGRNYRMVEPEREFIIIDNDQADELYSLINSINDSNCLINLLNHFKIKNINEMSLKQYETAMRILNKKLKVQEEENESATVA